MRFCVYLSLVFGLFTGAQSYSRSLNSSEMTTERGFFSIYGNYSYLQSQLLNPDGTHALYRGFEYGLGLDLRLGQGGPGEFRVFVNSNWSSQKGKEGLPSTLKAQQTFGGFKVFTNNYLYLGAGYGQVTQTLEINRGRSEMSNTMLAVGVGLEFRVSESFFGSMDLWYKTNPLKNSPGLTANSFSEAAALGLRVIYSPASVSITNILRGGH